MKDKLILYSQTKDRKDSVIDGAINEDIYKKQDIKIVFYLKEAYGYEGCGLIDIADLYDGWIDARIKTDINCTLLAKNIIDSFSSKEIFEETIFNSSFHNNEALKEAARKFAHVNIKKISGDSKSDDKIIRSFSREDSEILKEQIISLKPDLIICGGTVAWHSLILDLGIFNDSIVDLKKPGIIKSNDFWLCHLNHPGARLKKHFNTYLIYKMIMERLLS